MAQGTCSIDGCGRTGRVHLGWCVGHYTRFVRTGDVGGPEVAPVRVVIPKGTSCAVADCGRPAHCRGWCKLHYTRWERHGDVQAHLPVKVADPDQRCSVEACDRKLAARSYCAPHYHRWRKAGDPQPYKPIAGQPRACTAPGCADPHSALGYCLRHWARFKTYGDVTGGHFEVAASARLGRDLPPADRFWTRVHKNGPTVRPDLGPCWIWTAGKNAAGYGQMFFMREVSQLAHRVAWHLDGRPLITGLVLDHLCRTPACVRPDHLEQVTAAVNKARGNSWAAANSRKTHCAHGHPFDADNTIVNERGHRTCRRCRNDKPVRLAAQRKLTRLERGIAADYRVAIRDDPCRYCGGPGSEDDHYYPIAKGGTAHWHNLVRACRRCNRSKGARCGTVYLLRRGEQQWWTPQPVPAATHPMTPASAMATPRAPASSAPRGPSAAARSASSTAVRPPRFALRRIGA